MIISKKVNLLSCACLMALAVPAFANAQDASSKASNDTVVVTGSRIRVSAPVGSSMIALSRDTITNSPNVTVDRIIKELPQVFDLGVSENSRGQSGGSGNIVYSNTINIRGIGPYATLILIDGHRVTSNTRSMDPSVMPALGVERVEVVADGASAIYGSDAVAGVVNIVPRRNLDGIEATAKYGQSEDGAYDESSYGLAWGKVFEGGQAMLAYEHVARSNLSGLDRPFFTSNQTAMGGSDTRITRCDPGTIKLGSTTYAIPTGGLTSANVGSLVAGSTNKCEELAGQDLFPEQTYDSVNGTFTLEVNENITLFADAFHSRREFVRNSAFTNQTITVPTTNAFYVDINGAAADVPYTIDYNFAKDLPNNASYGHAESWQFTPGVRIKLPNDWRAEVLWGAGETNDDSFTLYGITNSARDAALASSNTATAFDPYGLHRTSQAVLDGIATAKQYNPTIGKFNGGEFRLNGDLFELPGGTVRAAFGYERQNITVDAGGGLPPIAYRHFERQVDSAYGEFLIPLVGDGNAMPLIQNLDLDLAYRYDEYSDVGNTSNPKIGVNWTVNDQIKVRASYGTSFRAPTILQIYGNSNNFFVQNYQIPTGGSMVGVAISGANTGLKPETAETWSLGVDWNPTNSLRFNLTYFDVKYDNQVSAVLSDLTVLSLEPAYTAIGVIYRGTAAQAQVQNFINQGLTIRAGGTPLPAVNTIDLFVDGRSVNLGQSITRGIDFTANYRLDTDNLGRFDFGLTGTYLTDYRYAVAPGAPMVDSLNNIFQPLEFKARGTMTWRKDAFMASLRATYINGYTNNTVKPSQEVDSYTLVDFNGSVDVDKFFPNLLNAKNITLGVEVRNVFDQDPPYVNIKPNANGGGGYDPTLTNPIGRAFAISLRTKW